MAGGRIGLTVCAISYAESFGFSVVCDEAMVDDTYILNNLMDSNIKQEIKRMENTAVP